MNGGPSRAKTTDSFVAIAIAFFPVGVPVAAPARPDMPREQPVKQSNDAADKITSERQGIRQERIPLGIVLMLIATILFAGSSALSKWLVATYPIGEMLFVRAATALVGSSLAILPATGLSVFRT